jgi:hypothetical protein
MSGQLWKQSDDWVGTEIDGSFVMVSVETGKYVALNETAHAIWDAVETPQSDAAIVGRLRDQFDVDATEGLDTDVSGALESMLKLGLLQRSETAA